MDGEPEPRPETERVAAGSRARITGLLAVASLLTVVGIGLSARSDAPDPQSSSAAVGRATPGPSAAPTAAQTTRGAAVSATPRATPEKPPQPPLATPPRSVYRGDDYLGVTLVIDQRVYFSLLPEVARGQFSTELRLSFPAPETRVELELVQLWTRDERPDFRSIGTFELRYGPLLPGSDMTRVVLQQEVAPRKRPRDAPRLIRDGYTVQVRTESRRDRAMLVLEVTSRRTRLDQSGRLPLIRLVAQPGTPRGTMVLGHSWVAGY